MAEATARRHFSKAAYFDKIKDYRVKHFYIPRQKKARKIPSHKKFHQQNQYIFTSLSLGYFTL